jgi:ribose transport system ATP-binding protein
VNPSTHLDPPPPAPVLAATAVSKTFGLRRVLDAVDLEVLPGEAHGLAGQNGSGKSTLIKVLAGYHAPDPGAGTLSMGGREVPLPLAAGQSRKLGLSFVHQDLGLVDTGTVLENLRLGDYETGFGRRISWRRERRAAAQGLEEFGVHVHPDTLVGDLREIDRALVAILRALEQIKHSDAGLLVLDEATAYLPQDGIARLVAAIAEIKSRGFGVLFVSHRLDEMLELCDRVSVLRDGRLVTTQPTDTLTEESLIHAILGRDLGELYPEPHHSSEEVVLRASGLRTAILDGLDLEVRAGEIVGLTGLAGMGWEEVPYAVFGSVPDTEGSVAISGREHDMHGFTPDRAIPAGLALVPANRLRDGVVGEASATENITLPTLREHFRRGVLRRGEEVRAAEELMTRFEVRPLDSAQPLGSFSGGNQQKMLLAKWFATEPRVLLMHEPTQGVDIGTKRQIFESMRDAAESGMGIVMASAEVEDLAHLCDRVLVFRDGRVASELRGGALSAERIVEHSFRTSAAA